MPQPSRNRTNSTPFASKTFTWLWRSTADAPFGNPNLRPKYNAINLDLGHYTAGTSGSRSHF